MGISDYLTQQTAQVIRVTRPDTLLIRTFVPSVSANVNMHLVLENVKCQPEAKQEIVDWCELHADWERLRLISPEWVRDSYGRVLGDLADLQSGEVLTTYLLERHVASPWPNHYYDVLTEGLLSGGPECS
jgi:hypothetical protein